MATILDIMRFRSGPSRFEALVRPHLQPLFSAAYRFCGNTADAEDLVQDVLVKLYPKRQELEAVKKLRPWLMTVLFRTFVDKKRKRDRSPISLMTLVGRDREGYVDYFENVASDDPGPEKSLENLFSRRQLEQALATLNDDQRVLCVLHDMEGYTLQEITEILDTPLGTLKSRLHRARARLRSQLGQGTLSVTKTSFEGKR